jgi:FtsZ-interacting cell division protein YlmF
MSGLWSRTLVYLGLREEADELYFDLSDEGVDDPYAQHDPRDSRRGADDREHRSRARHDWEDDDLQDQRGAGRDPRGRDPRDRDPRERDPRDRDPREDERHLDDARGRDRDRGRGRRGRRDDEGIEQGPDSGRIARIGSDNVRQIRPEEAPVRPSGGPTVKLVHLTSFEDCEVIGQRFRTNSPVLFDLSRTEKPVARRVLDFVSGMTFVNYGTLRRVGDRAFLLVPDRVPIPPDERRRISDLGYDLSGLPNP